ncbi:glycosyltransferase [Antrihabitans sp. NCIMB 15449]|uniref:Glycosyltransferase n=1 Tax=Antrihabitans spumae TaxID=3373370 RepID=A0ABW7JGI6_9NOCA
MDSLRVLILGINYAPESTGIAPYTTGLAEGLARKGHDVRVVTGLPHYPQWKIAPGYENRAAFDEQVGELMIHRVPHFVPDPPSARGRVRMEASYGRGLVRSKWGWRAKSLIRPVDARDVTLASALQP